MTQNRNSYYIFTDNMEDKRQIAQSSIEKLEKGYAEGSWQHNRYIWDTWWCKLGGGATGHIPSRDAAYETYVKGVFDFKTSPSLCSLCTNLYANPNFSCTRFDFTFPS